MAVFLNKEVGEGGLRKPEEDVLLLPGLDTISGARLSPSRINVHEPHWCDQGRER